MADLARLLCAFGHHAAAPGETWNYGYGFTRCRHCGRDLVRSLIDDWCVPPRGYRVTWRPKPLRLPAPPAAPVAPHVPPPQPVAVKPTAPTTAARDFMDEPTPQPSRRPSPPRPAVFDDFMSDAPAPTRSTGTNGRQ